MESSVIKSIGKTKYRNELFFQLKEKTITFTSQETMKMNVLTEKEVVARG
jgi:hypothetical protein